MENNTWIVASRKLEFETHGLNEKLSFELIPVREDPPWWSSVGGAVWQYAACVEVHWCGYIAWTHLKESADAGRRQGGGSSHPDVGKCAQQVYLSVPTDVVLED